MNETSIESDREKTIETKCAETLRCRFPTEQRIVADTQPRKKENIDDSYLTTHAVGCILVFLILQV